MAGGSDTLHPSPSSSTLVFGDDAIDGRKLRRTDAGMQRERERAYNGSDLGEASAEFRLRRADA